MEKTFGTTFSCAFEHFLSDKGGVRDQVVLKVITDNAIMNSLQDSIVRAP
jgi:hypothetical protein